MPRPFIFIFFLYAKYVFSQLFSIPSNCTVQNNITDTRVFRCPEYNFSIWRVNFCDGEALCQTSQIDEKVCVDYGPAGASYITYEDDTVAVGVKAPVKVPRIYMPKLDCSAPVCVDNAKPEDLTFMAHLLCRQMKRVTYGRVATYAVRAVDPWPVYVPSSVYKCVGNEKTVQNCWKGDPDFANETLLTVSCGRVLALSCAVQCLHEISAPNDNATHLLTSPGFPKYILPNTDCTWSLSSPKRIFVLQVLFMNLQVPGADAQSGNEDGYDDSGDSEPVCLGTYVELGLGLSDDGKFVIKRICDMTSVGQNFTSYSGRIFIRFTAGDYKNIPGGNKGFALAYRTEQNPLLVTTVPANQRSTALSAGIIVAIVIAVIVALSLCVVGGAVIFKKFKLREQWMKRNRERELRRRLKDNRFLQSLDMPDIQGLLNRPVSCAACSKPIARLEDACEHYNVVLEYVKALQLYAAQNQDFEWTDECAELATRFPLKHTRSINSTRGNATNVTVDLDELIHEYSFRKGFIANGQPAGPSRAPACSDSLPSDSQTSSNATCKLATTPETLEKKSPLSHSKASAVRDFLAATLLGSAKKLSNSSWRTPSPNKASTPEQYEIETTNAPRIVTMTAPMINWSVSSESDNSRVRSEIEISASAEDLNTAPEVFEEEKKMKWLTPQRPTHWISEPRLDTIVEECVSPSPNKHALPVITINHLSRSA